MWLWIFILTGIIGIVCLLRSEYEKSHFVIKEYSVVSDKLNHRKRKLVFLSDLHNNQFGEHNSRLIAAIHKIQPDAVLIGGDMMVSKGKTELEVPLSLIESLAAKYPVYYGNGNHETRMDQDRQVYGGQYDRYRKILKSYGVILLSDAAVNFQEDLALAGVNLDKKCYRKFHGSELKVDDINRKVGMAKKDRFQILLSHSPLFLDTYEAWGADLTLAGHFHGGTIWLPFLGGLMTPQFQFFMPVCAGIFKKNQSTLIVSRGLGTHSINVRINNRPQIVVVNLVGKEE